MAQVAQPQLDNFNGNFPGTVASSPVYLFWCRAAGYILSVQSRPVNELEIA